MGGPVGEPGAEGNTRIEDRRANSRLSDARRARGLTQQELAEAVNAAHQHLFRCAAAIDANHVSKLERGVIFRPNRRYRAAFRTDRGAVAIPRPPR